jgi:acid phosphatase type 7
MQLRRFGRRAGNPARGYYSFDIGPWHAVALNSNCGLAGAPSCAHGSAQWSWLKQDLASHSQRCILAFFHHPYLGDVDYDGAHGRSWPAPEAGR